MYFLLQYIHSYIRVCLYNALQATYLYILVYKSTILMNFLFLCSELEEQTLQNISFECNTANRMLAIVGPVGAGKVSLSSNLKKIP